MVPRLNASMEITSAVTARFMAPPSTRSTGRSGGKSIRRRMPAPIPDPRACPSTTNNTATAMVAVSRHPLSGTHWLTSGIAKNAATAPATMPTMPPSVTTNPLRRPETR